jgi:hypothetical protein
MILIVRQFILNPEKNQNGTGDADGKAQNIDQRKGLIPDDGADGGNKEVSEHDA